MMEYEFKFGRKNVERFLDAVLAVEEHIDPYFFIKRELSPAEEKRRAEQRPKDGPYDDLWLLDKTKGKPVKRVRMILSEIRNHSRASGYLKKTS